VCVHHVRHFSLLQENVLVHSRHCDTLLIGVETNAQAAMDFFATIW
ncbi:TPA: hypothetical protein RSS49_005250, partial [Klebsiella pneumoniae]|nr:hypothetical protein [Klebsiella pneumoniae]